MYDCIGVLVVLAYAAVDYVVSHLFPERPDLFKDVAQLQSQITDLSKKFDAVESEVTALHVGNVRHR